jgi:outer membrane lipoprotein carrier protein
LRRCHPVACLLIVALGILPRPASAAPAGGEESREDRGADAALPALRAKISDPELRKVLDGFDQAQKNTTTLVARFTEEKRLRLLQRPVVSHGELFFLRPNQVRWEYLEPDRKVFVITEEQYVAYYPALKRAEEVPIKRFVGRRLFRFMGLGQSIDDLGRSYDFALAAKADLPGTRLLVLTPRKKKVRERMAEMKIWVDVTTFLPRKLQYVEADGDSTVLTFHDLRPNVEIAGSRFRLELPDDVVKSDTFNGFSLGEQSF